MLAVESSTNPLGKLQNAAVNHCHLCLCETQTAVEDGTFCTERRCEQYCWFRFCQTCSDSLTCCPQCKETSCSMPSINELSKGDLQRLFPNDSLYHMNERMFIEFTEQSVTIGVRPPPRSQYLSASRGVSRSYAPARAYVQGDKGVVKLEHGDEFAAWTVEKCSAGRLAKDVTMVRTLAQDGGTFSTEDLGPADTWTRALMYGVGAQYPLFVGHTRKGAVVEIALACNPALPGFLLKSENPVLAKTVLSAVDIPSDDWANTPTFNDPRVLVLQHPAKERVFVLSVQIIQERPLNVRCMRAFGKLALQPANSFVDSEGCLTEVFTGIAERKPYTMVVSSLLLDMFDIHYVPVDSNTQMAMDQKQLVKTVQCAPFWTTMALLWFERTPEEHGDAWAFSTKGTRDYFYKAICLP